MTFVKMILTTITLITMTLMLMTLITMTLITMKLIKITILTLTLIATNLQTRACNAYTTVMLTVTRLNVVAPIIRNYLTMPIFTHSKFFISLAWNSLQ
jgi:hypothetical protein